MVQPYSAFKPYDIEEKVKINAKIYNAIKITNRSYSQNKFIFLYKHTVKIRAIISALNMQA